jgi:hypothetical protein
MIALIHIGMPKTGSTTIQSFLQANRRQLRNDGILYRRYMHRTSQPEFAIAVESAADRLVSNPRVRGSLRITGLKRQRVLAAAFDSRLGHDIASAEWPRFIASSEYLGSYGRPDGFIDMLDRWMLKRFSEVRYLIYLRRQQDWAVSKYSQYVRGGGVMTLDEYVARQKLPNLDAFVAKWEAVVGAERLNVRLLDRQRLVGGDLIADFCDAANLDANRLKPCKRSNERLSERHAALLRKFNGSVRSKITAETPLWALGKIANKALVLVPSGSAGMKLEPAALERIRAATAESNERLRARRFPEHETLFGGA